MPSRRAAPTADSNAPIYPEMLRMTGVSGSVKFRAVVDTTGRISLGTLNVLSSDHQLFEMAVKNSLPRWRFTRAVVDGHPVRDTIDVDVHFTTAGGALQQLLEFKLVERVSPAPGRWSYTIGHPGIEPNAPMPDSATRSQVAIAVLDTLLAATVRTDALYPDRIACVALNLNGTVQEPTLANLLQLSRRGMAVVAYRRCPRTFGSPVAMLDSLGRRILDPPGEDPFSFQVRDFKPLSQNEVSATVMMTHATASTEFVCIAKRDATSTSGWRGRCVRYRSRVS